MTTTWIIAADSSRARILQVTDRSQHLAEIEDLLNPEGRVDDRQLTTDAHARFHASSGPARDREETSASEHATELLAKRPGDYPDKTRTAHRHHPLHLIPPPRLPGQPRQLLLAEEPRSVALRAVVLLREAPAGGCVLRPRAVSRRRRRLLRKVGRELVQLRVREPRRHRRHLRVLTLARAEHVERR